MDVCESESYTAFVSPYELGPLFTQLYNVLSKCKAVRFSVNCSFCINILCIMYIVHHPVS